MFLRLQAFLRDQGCCGFTARQGRLKAGKPYESSPDVTAALPACAHRPESKDGWNSVIWLPESPMTRFKKLAEQTRNDPVQATALAHSQAIFTCNRSATAERSTRSTGVRSCRC